VQCNVQLGIALGDVAVMGLVLTFGFLIGVKLLSE
jgi:hypothetical protein